MKFLHKRIGIGGQYSRWGYFLLIWKYVPCIDEVWKGPGWLLELVMPSPTLTTMTIVIHFYVNRRETSGRVEFLCCHWSDPQSIDIDIENKMLLVLE